MEDSPLSLVELRPRKKRVYWYVFEPSDEFEKPWWRPEETVSDREHWLSVQHDGSEVGRCKFTLDEGVVSHPQLGDMPHGQLDILAFEVAVSARGKGVGRDTVAAIRAAYPLPRLTALNDNEKSRGFWDSLGWVRIEHRIPSLRSERVTYSEPFPRKVSG
ncbi:GNAT family N-acetyltransferase [Leucobacter tenebrionis]|uniref:GNAT family N-acetyltransferase n=1 Tax=Leucobacter tenebrionis TaxID=2873270 RepID=UPI001CA666D1|nr:GNAT family N-acetyltransferase [Leucobacter tenebrionis]QZY52910.1 hypothetical protein KVY00_05610 [Leucobacter tenebrionis]